ncbi:MAG: TolC family protein [bacterium]
MKNAIEKINASESALKSAKAERILKLNAEVNTGYNKIISTLQQPATITIMAQEVKLPEPSFSPWNNEISVRLSQPLYTGGKISNTIKRVKIIRDSSLYEKKLNEIELCLDVSGAYWELKRAILFKKLYQNRREHSENILEIAKSRFEAGEIPKIELRQQEVALANISCELFNAQTSLDIAQERLCLLLNITNDNNIIPIDEPQVPEKFPYQQIDLIKMALTNRLEIQLAEKKIEEKESIIKITKSKKYPQIYLIVNHNWSAKEDEFDKSISETKATSWQVALTGSLLIFDGKQTSSEVEKALSELKMAKIELEDLKSKIKNEVSQVYKKLVNAKQIVETQIKNLSIAKENLKIATLQYKLGRITNTQLNETELALKDANTKLIEAQIDYKIQEARLKKVIGDYQ